MLVGLSEAKCSMCDNSFPKELVNITIVDLNEADVLFDYGFTRRLVSIIIVGLSKAKPTFDDSFTKAIGEET